MAFQMKSKDFKDIRTKHPICIRVGLTALLLIALGLPAAYFSVSYTYLKGTLEAEAEANASIISGVITANPELWRFEQMRLQELLSQRSRFGHVETRRILDNHNVVIAESINSLTRPITTRVFHILDSGEPVGRVEISRSLLPTLIITGIVAVFGFLLGVLIIYLLWKLAFKDMFLLQDEKTEALSLLNATLESTAEGILVVDLQGKNVLWNSKLLELWHVPVEVVSVHSHEQFLGHVLSQLAEPDAFLNISDGVVQAAGGIKFRYGWFSRWPHF